jgi:hypothetical protein
MWILSLIPTPNITHTDVWLVLVLTAFVIISIKACRGFKMPDPGLVQNYATVCNTKGGIILLLLLLWLGTLGLITVFCIWVVARGFDPQNSVIVTLLGTLIGTAFGTVNGALFKTMTGEDPKLDLHKPGSGPVPAPSPEPGPGPGPGPGPEDKGEAQKN